MIDIYVRRGERVPLGREGTRGVRRVIFDSTRWVREYGEGVVQLIVQRPGESQTYPIALIYEDDTAIWEVNSADTAIPGEGKCEWQYYVGDKLEKSEIYTTLIVDSLADPTDEAPDRYDIWMEALLEVASVAEMYKRGAETARQGAETAAAAAAGSRDGAAAQAAAASKSAQSAAQSEAAALEAEEKVVTLVTKAVKPEWPSVQYRPVEYESIGDTITWDGNEEGMIACTFPVWFLVAPLTDEDVEKIRANPELFEQGVAVDQDGTERGFDKAEENRLRYDKECVLVVLEDNLVLVNDIVFPYKGVYFFSGSQSNSGGSVNIKTASFTVPGFEFHREIIKPIAVPYAVSTKPQALTEAQQMQARKNLGLPYSEGGLVEVLAEAEHTASAEMDGGVLLPNIVLELGKNYIVKHNGVEYPCAAQDLSAMQAGAVGIGNVAAVIGTGTSNDEPFAAVYLPGTGCGYMDIEAGMAGIEATFTAGIYENGEIIHKLDNKYIDAEWMATTKVGKGAAILAEKTYTSSLTETTEIVKDDFTEGQRVVVVCDGVEYERTVFAVTGDSDTGHCIGNTGVIDYPQTEGTGEPFYILATEAVTIVAFKNSSGGTLAIYPIEEIPDPLPEKFLPVASAVDLTAYESEGKIVETYPDGSVVTYSVEFNDDGKPVKISDSNGNVTVLTW